ncbi:Ribose import permease protein RbsC [bioreactor metagenome]|jgi:ribose/xylose/arabinose/galactoside ABC-type transport system permease subunit|uniref:D-ribose transporter subunit membrane component of ABC superfamily n=2 Tax=root TaxID=1 RepID=A0A652ZX17_9SPIR|nr:ABC transporter permease [Spirochaetia bacterium]MDD3980997.1 ABC transporter permease [Spirochaetales bacterium]VBB40310.1 D-ribose transporter subunit; membrane component of ABC superfamily [uncultured Spirochaetota bacterium]
MKGRVLSLLSEYGLFIILIALIALSAILSPLFFTTANIKNFIAQASYNGILSVGMTFVILIGGIDLSIGSIVGFASILYGSLMHGNFFTFMPNEIFIYKGAPVLTPALPLPFDVLFVLLIGAILGFLTGSISRRFRIHTFIVSLCMMIFVRGLAVSYTNGQPLFGVPDPISFLAYGEPLGIPMPAIIWVFICLIAVWILRYTRFGRNIYAVGGDEEAARLSGIQPSLYQIFPLVVSGSLASLVGIIMSGRMGCGDPKIGEGWQTDAIAAVVIGGANLAGGKGGIGGTIIGVLIMGLINNVMNLLEIDAYPQQMAKGIIIIIALAIQGLFSARNANE